MPMTPPTNTPLISRGISLATREIENHYADKRVYAIPEWAKLTGAPQIIAIVEIHGQAGLAIARQRVDFAVDFSEAASIENYARFLSWQMDTQLPTAGYILFYAKNAMAIKDPEHPNGLSDSEQAELARFNAGASKTEISLIILNESLEQAASLDDLKTT